ncbi:MAG TPA: tetratricopeptide repeat protein [Blastocatellia bacterium]|nr:tetratricopeptide repeat protein [Blastocatellia bacterium]
MARKTVQLVVFTLAAFLIAPVAHGQDWAKAVSLFNQKQYREAAREFHAVLNANPDYWQAWYYIGFSHYQLKGYEDAIDSFDNYIKAAGDREKEKATGYYYIGFSHYQLKQYDKSASALQKYAATMDTLKEKVDPFARAALGRCYIYSERFADALAPLVAAAAAPEMKSNAANHYYIGFAYYKLNRTDDAISSLNQSLTIDPKDPDALSLLGDIYLARSRQNPADAAKAIAIGERLLAVASTERAWGLLGQAYLVDKQFAKAAPLLDKYAKAHPDNASSWFSLGLALSRSDQFKAAETALEQAVKLAPTNVAAMIELGYVYEADKQPEKALPVYERAFEASGRRDETARSSIQRLKQQLGKS